MQAGIRHMVIFVLKHDPESQQTRQFLADARDTLSAIPVVKSFEVFRQVSPKNRYQFGFSMDFAGDEEYRTYNEHPAHVEFVENRWAVEVADFLEIDLVQENA
jgi:hypothetical protein